MTRQDYFQVPMNFNSGPRRRVNEALRISFSANVTRSGRQGRGYEYVLCGLGR